MEDLALKCLGGRFGAGTQAGKGWGKELQLGSGMVGELKIGLERVGVEFGIK